MEKKEFILTIGMIVKNEEKVLDRCLASLKPIMDEIPCELIITDTGSTDKTVEIAKKYTDKILHFEWCSDFAKARNTGWNAAKGEWFMFIDADEYFESTKEIIDFFKSNEKNNYNTISIGIRSFTEGGFYADAKSSRCVKMLLPECGFVGEIHECLQYIVPVKYIPTVLYHTGYDFSDKEFLKAKHKRNLPILLKMHKENPDALIVYVELFYEYDAEDNQDEALKYARMGEEKEKKASKKNYSVFFTNCQMKSFKGKGKIYESLAMGEELLRKKPSEESGLIDIYAMLSSMYYDLCQYQKSIECIEKYFDLLKKYESNTLPSSLESNIVVFYCADFHVFQMKMYMALCNYKIGNYGIALINAENLDLENAICMEYDGYTLMINLAKRFNKKELILNQYNKIVYPELNKSKYNIFVVACENHVLESKENYEHFTNYFIHEKNDSSYLKYCKLRKHADDNNINEIKKLYNWFCENPKEIINTFSEIFYIAYKYDLDTSKIFATLDCEDAAFHMDVIASKHKTELLELSGYFALNNYNNSLENMLWSVFFKERHIINDDYSINKESIELYYKYINEMYMYTSNIYNNELLQDENIHVLPSIYRYAFYAYNALIYKSKGDGVVYLRYLKKALKVSPSAKRVINYLMNDFEKTVNKKDDVINEFNIHANKLKLEAKKYIDNNNIAMAKEIILGLEKLIPKDEELINLKKLIFG